VLPKKKTGRVTVTLSLDRIAELEKQAEKKGLPMPTLCRGILSEVADECKRKAA